MLDVVVGRIGRAHGIRGDVAVELRTDEPELRFAPGAALHAGDRVLTVEATRHHQGRLLVHFAEVPDRTAAEALRGVELTAFIDPERRPEDPEEFYDHQLVGLAVETVAGEAVGTVRAVEHGTGQDLLVLDTASGEVLFPFVTALVPEVDLEGGRLVVDDRPGLIPGPLAGG